MRALRVVSLTVLGALTSICTYEARPEARAEARAEAPPVNHIRIAAASDLKFALEEFKTDFKSSFPDSDIELVFGSSGQFEQQIEKGAPFDLFLSADSTYPKMLSDKGLTDEQPWVYGQGALVIWTRRDSGIDVEKGLEGLRDFKIKKIAIANPAHAPYGKSAKAALTNANLYDSIISKLVIGDSISQTAQFAQTGAADVALIALSLALSPELKKVGTFEIIKTDPLVQSAVVLKGALKKVHVVQFAKLLKSEKGTSIFKSYGFRPEGFANKEL